MKLRIDISTMHMETMTATGPMSLVFAMFQWVSSSERERLISMGVPFLFIGAKIADGHSEIYLDIEDRLAGVAKVCVKKATEIESATSARFVDVRIADVRNLYGMQIEPLASLEKLCSNDRNLYVYTTKDYVYNPQNWNHS